MQLVIAAIVMTVGVQPGIAGVATGTTVRASLIELRHVVYDSMYRNDANGLSLAIAALEKLAGHAIAEERPYVDYYSALANWGLSAAQLQNGDAEAALKSARAAVRHAQAGVDARPKDPEFYAVLANALIVVAILDQPNFIPTAKQLAPIRRQALELGPDNPRVVVMDAGMIFNNPPSRGGGQAKGLARWREAVELFEREAKAPVPDPLAPRWGHALALGWLANMLLSMGADHTQAAREAATLALQMRPDFWYVREQVLPRLK